MTINATVGEYMSPHPLTIRADETAMHTRNVFVENRFTVAPVVDRRGRCVGVVSATDLVGGSVASAASVLSGSGVHHAVVTNADDVVDGIFSTLDVARALLDSDLDQPVEWITSQEMVTVSPDAALHEARELLSEAGFSAAPVVSAGRVLGCVTQLTLLRGIEAGAERVDQRVEHPLRLVPEHATVRAVAALMATGEVRRVFVTDQGG